jgi:hypothetical protein
MAIMDKKVLIIIPAYQEEANIKNVVDNIINNYPQYDYLVVNDGSKDNTARICKDNGYSYLDLPINLGIGGAVQAGYKYALKNDYDIAIQIDGDGQHDVSFIEGMLKCMEEENADIVIGSRFIEKQGFQSSMSRRMGIHFLSNLIKICTGKRIHDVTSGFRIVNRKFIDLYASNYPSDYPEPEVIVLALEYGAKIIEEPVVMRERTEGTSSINIVKSIYYMVKVTLAIIICRISLGIRR